MPRLKNDAVEKAIQLLTNDPLNGVVVKESNADIVEVVRCKECIYQAECAFTEWLGRNGNGYCSCGEGGERREDAETD